LIQKYIGVRGSQPSLDTVGGKSWKGKQKKVLAALESMAEGMLEVQARRKLEKGIDFGPDDILQSAFEKAFPHTETPDQTVASREVKGDMARSQPMDRLLCGDVGYGKTEIAMRAAFKAIASGYQVAILVPTTVLAHQHEQTFKERFADFPVRIEVLSRMQKPSRRNLILEDTELGAVDCLIGTHRILSQDVQFERLGLVVIDEEQRFGVRAKELIKRWRETVDLLTMTATPIPRTLHMSLLGLRDISTLGTPPRGRKGVRTRVGPAGTNHIAGAIRHELERGGQVYFVHNRIHDIGKTQDFLERLIPEARITYAHGRMSGPQLERIIDAFVRHEIDVLVTTTIIESGVDIPNVNTLIVEDAHRFGLADLHQIRGRVGRGSRQAYAYFLTPYDQRVPESGRKRLRVLEDHQNLGAGLAIALRDLEIRGAGNILGTHQHGHIAAVGYEMYCKLLRKTVSLMTGETLPQQDLPGCHVTLINSSKIPVSYIPSDPLRLSFYRRLAHSRNEEELLTICQVLENDFGPLPPSVMDLMNSTRIRIAATRIGLTLLRELPDRFVLQAPSIEPVRMRLEEQGLAHRLIDFETAHLLIPGSTTPNDLLLTLLGLSLTSGGRYALSSTGSDG
jgi:transcription-repair coupling factor (superfamily II helicase)